MAVAFQQQNEGSLIPSYYKLISISDELRVYNWNGMWWWIHGFVAFVPKSCLFHFLLRAEVDLVISEW